VFAVDRVLNIAYVYVLVYQIAFATLAAEGVFVAKYPTRTGCNPNFLITVWLIGTDRFQLVSAIAQGQ